MIEQEITNLYNQIITSLEKKELKNCFDSLQALITQSREYSFQEKQNELQETYQYMLRYRMDGIKDPMHDQVYNHLQLSLYELTDTIRQKALTTVSVRAYYNQRRNNKFQPQLNYQQLHEQLCLQQEAGNQKEIDHLIGLLFNKVWVSPLLNQTEVGELRDILLDDTLPYAVCSQLVSALLLGLQEAFDDKKLMLLFDATHHWEEEIQVQALIALLLSLYIHKKRSTFYPRLADQLAILAEEPCFVSTVRSIILRFILTRDTEKISKKLHDEIFPEMLKLNQQINSKINLKDLSIEQLEEESNPEWQNIFADLKMDKHMEEFSELQQEGADVLHSTFIHLKQYPFFSEINNWLLPYNPQHSSFFHPSDNESNIQKYKQLLDSILYASFLCNSDKYSFAFSIIQMPKEIQPMMIGQFNLKSDFLAQHHQEENLDGRQKRNRIIGQYVQDLYRFYKLHPAHLDFNDIFNSALDFHNLPLLKSYLSDTETVKTIAEYYLRKNYFSEALPLFKQLAEADSENDILYQKIGYCYQMEGNWHEALEAYLHAELINSKSKWVIRRIANCYRTLKQPQKALNYYQRYETMNPDNLSVQINMGHCYIELKEYQEALKFFFKVEYLDTKSHKAWRPIAWCSFLSGRYEQAKYYYTKILEEQPNSQDYLNAGHTELVLGNIQTALTCYKQAIHLEGDQFTSFKPLFDQDRKELLNAGIEEKEIPLLLDQLRYSLDRK